METHEELEKESFRYLQGYMETIIEAALYFLPKPFRYLQGYMETIIEAALYFLPKPFRYL